MALPIGKKNNINVDSAPEKRPSGSLPKGPDRMPTKPVTPQSAATGKKKGPPMNVGQLPKP